MITQSPYTRQSSLRAFVRFFPTWFRILAITIVSALALGFIAMSALGAPHETIGIPQQHAWEGQ